MQGDSHPINVRLGLTPKDSRNQGVTSLVCSSRWHVAKVFKKYAKKAALSEQVHFHSLRHTFASWLVQDGVSLYAVQKRLGHSSISVTQVYSHLQPEQLHETVNRLKINVN